MSAFALSQSGSWWRIRDSFHGEADPRLARISDGSDWHLIGQTLQLVYWAQNYRFFWFKCSVFKKYFMYLNTVCCKVDYAAGVPCLIVTSNKACINGLAYVTLCTFLAMQWTIWGLVR